MKFLVDECLSPELTLMAHARGYGERSHIVWLGKSGIKDWDLMVFVLDGDWTLVTKNSYDFRGPARVPSTAGQYRRADLHAGLVCLNGPPGMDLDMQLDLFEAILDDVERDGDLVNKVLEITIIEAAATEIEISRYDLPKET